MYPVQRWAKNLGENGCYYLCLHSIAEEEMNGLLDSIRGYKACVDLGFISEEGWVHDAARVLGFLMNSEWNLKHADVGYSLQEGEQEITRYERKTAKGVISHFVRSNGKGQVSYDPFEPSDTVRLGEPVSKRIFWRVRK